jgi:hypothetical protein
MFCFELWTKGRDSWIFELTKYSTLASEMCRIESHQKEALAMEQDKETALLCSSPLLAHASLQN